MYGKAFCKVYNEFGWNYFPEAVAEQLLLWMEEKQLNVKSCLDIGCGTGVLCGILAEHGISSLGIDLSESMIEIAKKQYPNASFETANMITYRPNTSFDLVTCTGDALNHILDLDDVKKVFKNVHDCLTPGGYFIADILNEKETGNGEDIDFEFDDTTNARFTISKAKDNMVTLKIAVFEGNTFQFEEEIHEIIHDPDIICQLLQESGFSEVTCSHKLLEKQESQAITWFVVAKA